MFSRASENTLEAKPATLYITSSSQNCGSWCIFYLVLVSFLFFYAGYYTDKHPPEHRADPVHSRLERLAHDQLQPLQYAVWQRKYSTL